MNHLDPDPLYVYPDLPPLAEPKRRDPYLGLVLAGVLVILALWAVASRPATSTEAHPPIPSGSEDTGALRWAPLPVVDNTGARASGDRDLATGGALIVPATVVGGTATWYCCTRGYDSGDLVAAIDRKDSAWRKGDRVRVTHDGRSVVVRIVDVCGCKGARVIDLSPAAFRRLAPLSRGVVPVMLSDAELPATDTR